LGVAEFLEQARSFAWSVVAAKRPGCFLIGANRRQSAANILSIQVSSRILRLYLPSPQQLTKNTPKVHTLQVLPFNQMSQVTSKNPGPSTGGSFCTFGKLAPTPRQPSRRKSVETMHPKHLAKIGFVFSFSKINVSPQPPDVLNLKTDMQHLNPEAIR
jgi:hypothetical protein